MRRALVLAALLAATLGLHSHPWEHEGYELQRRPDSECPNCEEMRTCASLRCDCGAHKLGPCSQWARAPE